MKPVLVMTVPRMIGLFVGFVIIGTAAVAMRVEQSRHARRIQEMQFQQTDLRRQVWAQEMELARLRSPQMLRERAVRFGLVANPEDSSEGSPFRR